MQSQVRELLLRYSFFSLLILALPRLITSWKLLLHCRFSVLLYYLLQVWLVLRQGLRMAVIGAAIGLLGAWSAQKFTSGLLFGISPVDPLTFGGAPIFLLAVAAIACAIPGAVAEHVPALILVPRPAGQSRSVRTGLA